MFNVVPAGAAAAQSEPPLRTQAEACAGTCEASGNCSKLKERIQVAEGKQKHNAGT